MPTYKVAVPQWEPVWLDKAATTRRVIELIQEAASQGARLVAFGELSIPGYPTYLYGGRMNDIFSHNIQYFNNSLALNGPEINAIRFAAQENNMIVHVGFSEIDGKTLYMGNVIIDEHGEIILHRRKIKPSHYERTLFGESGPESAVNVVETSIGRVSVLNCWEHFQPLLKYHTYSQQPFIHIAAWPLLHPYGGQEQWSHCNESGVAVTRTVAIEAGAYALNCSQYVSAKGMATNKVHGISVEGDPTGAGHIVPGGGMSCVFAPDGSQVTKPIPDDAEAIVYADISTDMVHFAALVQDTVGHYSRPDMFQLVVNKTAAPRVVYREADGTFSSTGKKWKTFKELLAEKAETTA